MTPVYLHRRAKKQGARAGEQMASPTLPGDGQLSGIEVLEKPGTEASQWDSAYQQLFDRN